MSTRASIGLDIVEKYETGDEYRQLDLTYSYCVHICIINIIGSLEYQYYIIFSTRDTLIF